MGILTKAGFVLVDPETAAIERVLAFQYNPDQLAYTVTTATTEVGVSCELDATDALASGDPVAQRLGIAPQVAALAEVAAAPPPPDGPVILFVWGAARVATVEFSSLTVTEQAFNERLAPLRATIAIALRVVRSAEVGTTSKQGELAMAYEASQRQLAASVTNAALTDLGLTQIDSVAG
jgi:hypothetical protein